MPTVVMVLTTAQLPVDRDRRKEGFDPYTVRSSMVNVQILDERMRFDDVLQKQIEGSSSKALFNFAPRELLSITQAKFLCKRLFRVLLKSFLRSPPSFRAECASVRSASSTTALMPWRRSSTRAAASTVAECCSRSASAIRLSISPRCSTLQATKGTKAVAESATMM